MNSTHLRSGIVCLLLTTLHGCLALGGSSSGAQPSLASLDEGVWLARIGRSADSTVYRIHRRNLALAADGSVFSVIEASGTLVRTLLEEVEDGVWRESVAWREYRYGQRGAGSPTAETRPVEEARNLTYVVDPRARYPDALRVPTQALEPGPEATLFSVLVLDAWSWDGLLHELRRAGHSRVRPGTVYSLEGWEAAREVGPDATGLEGRYRLSAMQVTVVGLAACGTVGGCLRLSFRTDANRVVQDVQGMQVDGREYFVGTADFSLGDGSLVSGAIFGPLIATFTANGAALPIGSVLQSVTIGRVSSCCAS